MCTNSETVSENRCHCVILITELWEHVYHNDAELSVNGCRFFKKEHDDSKIDGGVTVMGKESSPCYQSLWYESLLYPILDPVFCCVYYLVNYLSLRFTDTLVILKLSNLQSYAYSLKCWEHKSTMIINIVHQIVKNEITIELIKICYALTCICTITSHGPMFPSAFEYFFVANENISFMVSSTI